MANWQPNAPGLKQAPIRRRGICPSPPACGREGGTYRKSDGKVKARAGEGRGGLGGGDASRSPPSPALSALVGSAPNGGGKL
jgi:hypothetical protein